MVFNIRNLIAVARYKGFTVNDAFTPVLLVHTIINNDTLLVLVYFMLALTYYKQNV